MVYGCMYVYSTYKYIPTCIYMNAIVSLCNRVGAVVVVIYSTGPLNVPLNLLPA